MTDEPFTQSRRSTLKLLAGLAAGATGAGTASATTDAFRGVEPVTNGERSEWVLYVDGAVDGVLQPMDDDTVSRAKTVAQQSKADTLATLEGMSGVETLNEFWLVNAILVSVDEGQVSPEQQFGALGDVSDYHPNFEFEGPEPVSEQRLRSMTTQEYTYGLEQVNVPEVWDRFGAHGEDVSVAVLDTGIDADHPDLELAPDGWAYFDDDGVEVDADPFDPSGHGTHVSGTIAGTGSDPVYGVAPEVDLLNAKVLDPTGTFTQIIAGMEWAIEEGADVINLSLGAVGYFDVWIEPVQNAIAHGTIVVSSSGNDGPETSGSPANVYDAFAVGASDPNREIAGFSSGEVVERSDWSADWLTSEWPINYVVPNVSAPGVAVWSAYPGDDYARLDGTSMASPHVAGIAALMLSAADDLSVEDVTTTLEETARHGGGPEANPDSRYGTGIVDALSATAAVTDGTLVTGTVTDTGGEPIEGATVTTAFGTEAKTDGDGAFSVYVDDGEWDVWAARFGYQTAEATVDASDEDAITADFQLEPAVDVRVLEGQPDVIGPGESFTIDLLVANLDELTVSPADDSDLGAEDLTIQVDGEDGDFDDPIAFGGLSGELTLTVSVSEDAEPDGTLTLEHEFDGPGGSLSLTTGPTEVLEDPQDASFQIVEWDESGEADLGGALELWVTVENQGDRTTRQDVAWWLGDPEGPNVFPTPVVLEGGESVTIPLTISVPDDFVPPTTQLPHGWSTDDDLVSTEVTFFGPYYAFGDDDLEAPTQVDYGDPFEVQLTVTNVGNTDATDTVEFSFNDVFQGSEVVSAGVGDTDTVTFSFDSTQVVRGQYEYRVTGTFDQVATGLVWIGEPEVPPELAPYVTEQRIVDTDGLRGVIDDWRGGAVDTDLLRDVIDHWRSGEPVV